MIQQISTEESIRRILITPLVSRVNMPDYGSRLFELIDKPVNDEWILDATRYTFEAVERNEPRAKIKKVFISTGDTVTISIEYFDEDIPETLNIDFTEVQDAAA